MTGSDTRLLQLDNPTQVGDPMPDQLVKDSHTTNPNGSSARIVKYTVAGIAQMMLGRPTSCARDHRRGRRTRRPLVPSEPPRSSWTTTAILRPSFGPAGRGGDIADRNPWTFMLSKNVPTASWIGVICCGGHAWSHDSWK